MLYDDIIEVRLCAAEELGRLGDRIGESEVLGYLKNQPHNTKETFIADGFAARAIGYIGTSTLTKFLPELLANRSTTVKLSAAQAVLMQTQKK